MRTHLGLPRLEGVLAGLAVLPHEHTLHLLVFLDDAARLLDRLDLCARGGPVRRERGAA